MEDKTYYVHFDEKVTTWIRNTVAVKGCSSYKEAAEKVIKNIKNDHFEYYTNSDISICDTEEMSDCEEPLSPSENGQMDTIEVLDEDYQVMWDNVDGYYEDNK
jgi:hypothetical protein